jgi:hypothetical protein
MRIERLSVKLPSLRHSLIILLVLLGAGTFITILHKKKTVHIEKPTLHYKEMGPLIGKVIDALAKKETGSFAIGELKAQVSIQDFMGNVRLVKVETSNGALYQFFGISEVDEPKIKFADFKEKVMTHLKVSGKPTIQLIGDSNQFSSQGTTFARFFLAKQFKNDAFIEYGYTGHQSDGKELDVNSFVNEYIDKNPARAERVLGNVVNQSKTAIEKWGCYVSPHIKNFVVVYNDHGSDPHHGTIFGSDVIISDRFLSPQKNDRVICLEGGIQAFLQVCNSLLLDLPVTFVYNLRKDKIKGFFSTAEFFSILQQEIPLTKDKIWELYEIYSKTHHGWDPTRQDANTKKALFEMAMYRFLEDGAYKKIDTLCTFINGSK